MNYESFLDDQITRQRAVWFRDLPVMLADLTQAIQMVSVIMESATLEKQARFEATLAKLRAHYRQIKSCIQNSHSHDSEQDSRKSVDQMITLIRQWYRTTRVAVDLKTEMNSKYRGKAAVAKSYSIEVSDKF